jgi:protein SCO1/2
MSRPLLALLLLLGASACARPLGGPRGEEPRPLGVDTTASVGPKAPPAREPLGPSVYELGTRLRDDAARASTLDRFRGHPVLITMFYGSCASACPLLTSELKRIERSLPEATRANLRVLMVSFDEARDTPPELRRLKAARNVDPARWTFASTSDDEARELSGVLGIRYRKLDNGEYFHSSVIVLLDAEGRPLVKLSGIGEDLTPVVLALSARGA